MRVLVHNSGSLQPACFRISAIVGILILNAPRVAGEDSGYATVSRILAQHCLECHGPDASQREAELQLHLAESSTMPLESGQTAIVPGHPDQSELITRVTAVDDSRMPPEKSGRALNDSEVELLRNWIANGADFEQHWTQISNPTTDPPSVKDSSRVQQTLDRFIIAQHEAHSLPPFETADRVTLIRRVWFDLAGLPPTPERVAAFVNDESPDAFANVVDELLASPLYGQRWGRHWMDVVRYGDSNGSDENHAYPLAWHYRNYIIDALNDDLPFDQFVREQLAGDLLTDKEKRPTSVTGTGFLAIGTKILAERDPVKKQADIVDEQIDTIGKALLGFTISCARCHDHKFDPIPTADYYALAGILHSTTQSTVEVPLPDFEQETKRIRTLLDEIKAEQKRLNNQLQKTPGAVIEREAEDFDRANVPRILDGYGKGIGIISDPGGQKNFVEWDFEIPQAGEYLIYLRYAAEASRPGVLSLNGNVVRNDAVSKITGGWYPTHQQWFQESKTAFRAGRNTLKFTCEPTMSHIDRLRLVRVSKDNARMLARVEQLDRQQKQLEKQMPAPMKVMGVGDRSPMNAKIYLRGSHLDPGREIPRGFPWVAAPGRSPAPIPTDTASSTSGRLQLAQWITAPQAGAGHQLARVIVNRVWQWHFGRGIVTTPNNFGLQGALPTHPDLLNWLATEFIRDRWSLKNLHRRILLSSTWQQASVTRIGRQGRPELFYGFQRRRLEAEAIRDTLLFHAGRLDTNPAKSIGGVKSQDPTPEDLQRNEDVHRHSEKRSVFLPVVRSNTYRFFSLFDFPNANTSVGRRGTTTIPTQALLMMNDPFVMDQAQHLAKRVLSSSDKETMVRNTWLRLFSRAPTKKESKEAALFLRKYSNTIGSENTEEQAFIALCHSLILSSEFIHVE
ncbi:MAG TPA: hypothetical protein DCG12_11875 [Planctomycetaceae bacterium]|nr:hypothetical protein [Planctomycetaceae bacterium]